MCVFKRLKKHKAIENFDHFLFNFMPAVFCFKYLVQSLVAVPFVRQPIHNTISEIFCQQFLITFLKFFKSFFLPLFSLYDHTPHPSLRDTFPSNNLNRPSN